VSFTSWLIRQESRRDAIGDLAKEMRRDITWPHFAKSLEGYRKYLEKRRACDDAISALESAWEKWQKLSLNKG